MIAYEVGIVWVTSTQGKLTALALSTVNVESFDLKLEIIKLILNSCVTFLVYLNEYLRL